MDAFHPSYQMLNHDWYIDIDIDGSLNAYFNPLPSHCGCWRTQNDTFHNGHQAGKWHNTFHLNEQMEWKENA